MGQISIHLRTVLHLAQLSHGVQVPRPAFSYAQAATFLQFDCAGSQVQPHPLSPDALVGRRNLPRQLLKKSQNLKQAPPTTALHAKLCMTKALPAEGLTLGNVAGRVSLTTEAVPWLCRHLSTFQVPWTIGNLAVLRPKSYKIRTRHPNRTRNPCSSRGLCAEACFRI